MEHNHFLDDPLVAYKAGLAEALGCLLTAEEGEERGSDSGAPGVVELLASCSCSGISIFIIPMLLLVEPICKISEFHVYK